MSPSALAAVRSMFSARFASSALWRMRPTYHQAALFSSSPSATPTPTPTPSPPNSKLPSKFEVDNAHFHDYTMRDLLNARVHMGHRTRLVNRGMVPYLLGERNGMHIIDLDKTVPLLRRALTAASLMAEHDCTFLWLAPSDQQKMHIVERQAVRAGAYTIDGARWIGGTLTNSIMSGQAKRFNYRVPDCVFVIDANRHMPALREAKNCGIPTIGIADSDCDPNMLTYPIPGNDDAALSIYLYCSLMRHAILDGRRRGRRLNRPSLQIPTIATTQRSRSHRSRS